MVCDTFYEVCFTTTRGENDSVIVQARDKEQALIKAKTVLGHSHYRTIGRVREY